MNAVFRHFRNQKTATNNTKFQRYAKLNTRKFKTIGVTLIGRQTLRRGTKKWYFTCTKIQLHAHNKGPS